MLLSSKKWPNQERKEGVEARGITRFYLMDQVLEVVVKAVVRKLEDGRRKEKERGVERAWEVMMRTADVAPNVEE